MKNNKCAVLVVSVTTCSNCRSEVTEIIKGTNLCTACNTAKLGKYQKNMLRFAEMLGDRWHSLANDNFTRKVAKSLENRGLIEINEKYSMFRKA